MNCLHRSLHLEGEPFCRRRRRRLRHRRLRRRLLRHNHRRRQRLHCLQPKIAAAVSQCNQGRQ